MTETLAAENNNNGEINSPGELLRIQRKKMGLSIQDIAKRIRLNIELIEAIEGDNYADMPTAIYVRGYLRNYAKVVGADVEQVIRFYDTDSPPPPEILPDVKPPVQISSNDKPVKAFTYLLSLGLVLLLLIWYQSNFVVNTATNQDILIEGDIKQDIEDVTIHPDEGQTPVADDTTEQAIDAELADQIMTDEGEPVIVEPLIQDETLELQTDSGEGTLSPRPVDGLEKDQENVISGDGTDTILLSLSNDSWVEIYDANDQRLFLDLALSGEKYLIKGTAPFSVLFGFSQGVLIEFNGEQIDHSVYSKNGIAHFKLPE